LKFNQWTPLVENSTNGTPTRETSLRACDDVGAPVPGSKYKKPRQKKLWTSSATPKLVFRAAGLRRRHWLDSMPLVEIQPMVRI
jgi:hypothetical protein